MRVVLQIISQSRAYLLTSYATPSEAPLYAGVLATQDQTSPCVDVFTPGGGSPFLQALAALNADQVGCTELFFISPETQCHGNVLHCAVLSCSKIAIV